MDKPPSGVRFEPAADGFLLSASCVSFGDAILRVGFAGVLCALPFKLWSDLILGVWSDTGLSFWLTLMFLTVWACVILYACWLGALTLAGVVRITKAGDAGEVFTGIGAVGRRHRFRWSEYQGASASLVTLGGSSRHTTRYVFLNGAKRYKFGWQLPGERQDYIVKILQEHAFRF